MSIGWSKGRITGSVDGGDKANEGADSMKISTRGGRCRCHDRNGRWWKRASAVDWVQNKDPDHSD